jgi:hypothetical protein
MEKKYSASAWSLHGREMNCPQDHWSDEKTGLALSNPIFLPTAYSPALICFGRERGLWITCNYLTVLKEKNIEKQKEYSLRYLLAKACTTWGKGLTGSDSRRTNATKTVSDVFRHRSGTGKSYCWTRSDVGSERVRMEVERCSWWPSPHW